METYTNDVIDREIRGPKGKDRRYVDGLIRKILRWSNERSFGSLVKGNSRFRFIECSGLTRYLRKTGRDRGRGNTWIRGWGKGTN